LRVYINGQFYPEAEAKIPVFDHGHLYGDGVFEGIRVYNSRIWKGVEHVERLYRSAHHFLITIPHTQAEFLDKIRETVRTNELSNAYVRVTITRGNALGLDPRNVTSGANVIIIASALALYPESAYTHGLEVVTVSLRTPSSDVIDPRIKSLGRYVNNIMAKFQANMVGAGEGLMLNTQGYVAEATGDNVFVIHKGRLLTPPASCGILEGITREVAMELAREEGIPVEERLMTLYDLYNADEAFLTGTAAEMIPMVKLDDRAIGTGKPGPITEHLIRRFRARTQEEGVPV
jgi:branched-chain amino acid aminotransferase